MIRPVTPTDDAAPGLTDDEVRQLAQAHWLQEQEDKTDDEYDNRPDDRYEWS